MFTPEELEREDKCFEAYKLRLRNCSYRKIAHQLGIPLATVHDYVQRARELYKQERLTNLAEIRRERLLELELLAEESWEDLANCRDIIDDETGRMIRDGIRNRDSIRKNLQANISERCKLEGLYDTEKVESSEIKPEVAEKVDTTQLGLEGLMAMFSKNQKNKN